MEEKSAAIVETQHDVPNAEEGFSAEAVGEDGEEPLEGQGFELDSQVVEVGGEFGEDFRDVLAEDLLVGAGGEEGVVVVVAREDVFNHAGEDPEGVFGGGHNKEEGAGDEIHALAVAYFWVAAGVGEEDFVKFGDAGAFAEENVVG